MVRRTRSSVIAAALLVAVAACGSPSPSGTSPAAPGASSAAASPAESVPPMAAGPAWDAINDAVGDDGHVSKDTALQAFALTFGGLPGVTPPPGDAGTIPSGSMALRWLVGYWDQLSAEQRKAAVAAVPDLAGIASTSDTPRAVTLAVAHPPAPPAGAPLSAPHRTNAAYTQLANQMVGQIESHLGSNPGFDLTVDAHYGAPQDWKAGMETGVYDSQGGIGGIPAKCLITVSPLGDGHPDVDVASMMAHEVWHCYEGALVGLQRYWSSNPADWIVEGEASWVGGTLVDAPVSTGLWWDYLYRPDLPLFKRSYSAIGFFGHLEAAGVDPWDVIVPVVQEQSNEAAFAASGADNDKFLDSWASSLLDDPARQQPWTLTGPARPPPGKSKPVEIHLANGGSVQVEAAPYAMDISVFAQSPEVLKTSFAGRARLSDTAGHDYLAGDGDGTFCMLPTGCECPGASPDEPPMLALDGDRVALGVTGGPKGSSGTLTGVKLDDYCTGITGTWEGVWQNSPEWGGATGGFTMTAVQKGAAFTGTTDVTGPTCVRHGKVTGTVTKNHLSMGWLAAGVRDVQFEGTVSGKTMSGTWSAYACKPKDLLIEGSWSATKVK